MAASIRYKNQNIFQVKRVAMSKGFSLKVIANFNSPAGRATMVEIQFPPIK